LKLSLKNLVIDALRLWSLLISLIVFPRLRWCYLGLGLPSLSVFLPELVQCSSSLVAKVNNDYTQETRTGCDV